MSSDVISCALNDDLPFDEFTIWQLAGDLLPDATIDQKIASGFNRNHLLNGEGGAIAEEQRWVNLFDRIDTTLTTWLGLTMACAQCHDHKYDPITQRDYYSLLDAFNRVPERGTPQRFSTRIRVDAPFLELPTDENKVRIAAFDAKLVIMDEPTANLGATAIAKVRETISRLKAHGVAVIVISGAPGAGVMVPTTSYSPAIFSNTLISGAAGAKDITASIERFDALRHVPDLRELKARLSAEVAVDGSARPDNFRSVSSQRRHHA